jgi:integrase
MAYGEKRVSEAKGSKGKVSWRARYKKPDSTWGSEPGFPTKKTAEDWGEEQEAAIRAGRWIDPDLARKPFGVWAREWMKARSPRGRTVDTRWTRLEDHILPKWEHTPLLDINWFDVESWANGLDCAEVTINHCVSLMSSIMTGAVDKKHLTVNPLYGRRRSTTSGNAAARKAKTAAAKRAKIEHWARPEVVLRLAEGLGPARGLMVVTAAFTGMGWGELCALHRDNTLLVREEDYGAGVFCCPIIRIDPEVGELSEVQLRDEDGKKLGVALQLEAPKNENRARDIDIPPFLAILLRAHLMDWPHDYLFSTKEKGDFLRNSNWGKVMRPACDGRAAVPRQRGTAGVEGWAPIQTGLTMRALRHTHDTYQDQIGVRPALQFEAAGHARPGMKGIYQHPTPAMRIERLAGLQEIYERAMRTLGWRGHWGRVNLMKWTPENDLPDIAQTISIGRPRRTKPQSRSTKVG